MVRLEIPGSAEYVSIVRHAVGGLARRMSFSQTQIDDLMLAVGEACTNAVKHGCNDNGCRRVEINCLVVADGLMVEIRNAIDDCESPAVPERPDLSKEGGLGLWLIHQVVDEVDFAWDADTAVIRMLKRVGTGM